MEYCKAVKKKATSIYGNKNISNMTHELRAINEVHIWYCKINRIYCTFVEEEIKQYMSELGIKPIDVEVLPRHGVELDALLLMHLTVPYDDKDKVMQSMFWPKGIRVSS